MKKNLLFLGLASLMLTFTGCTRDDVDDGTSTPPLVRGELAPQTIIATVGDGVTRTMFTSDFKSIMWVERDRIAVVGYEKMAGADVAKNVEYEYDCSDLTASGIFKQVDASREQFFLPLSIGGTLAGETEPLQRCIAGFPAENMTFQQFSTDNAMLSLRVPETQTFSPNSYDPKALVGVAAFTNDKDRAYMHFKYANSLLCLPVSAAQASTFDRIEVVAASYGYLFNVTGRVGLHFTANPWDEGTAEERLANFTDMTQPLRLSMVEPTETSQSQTSYLTMTGTAEHPLTFGADETKIYFGILPQNYSEMTMSFFFCYADGSKFEKICTPKNALAGDVITLPSSSVSKPYIPELKYDATTKNVSWTENAAAKSYEMNVMLHGVAITPITLTAGTTSVNLEKDIYPVLKSLDPSIIKGGTRYDLELVLKATLASKAVASASYSIPFEFTFTKEAVKSVPEIIATDDWMGMPTLGTTGFQYWIANYYSMVNNSATLSIDYVEKANAVYPDDFAGAKSVVVTYEYGSPYMDPNFNWKRGVSYTMVCKAIYTEGPAMVSTPITSFVDFGPLPTAVNASLKRNKLSIANYDEIMAGCPDAEITVYAKVGENQPMDNVAGLESGKFTADNGMAGHSMDVSKLPANKGTQLCSYKVVVTSSRLTTQLTKVLYEHPVVVPTSVLLQADDSGLVNITNKDEILDYASDAVFTVYVKKGVNQDMTNVTGLESKILSSDYLVLDLTTLPYEDYGMYYTYKFVVTGTGLPAAGITGIYSEEAPAKPTEIQLEYDARLNIHVGNINVIMYHYPDATVKVYTDTKKVTSVDGLKFVTLTTTNRSFDPGSFYAAGSDKFYHYYKIVVETPAHPEGVLTQNVTFAVPGN